MKKQVSAVYYYQGSCLCRYCRIYLVCAHTHTTVRQWTRGESHANSFCAYYRSVSNRIQEKAKLFQLLLYQRGAQKMRLGQQLGRRQRRTRDFSGMTSESLTQTGNINPFAKIQKRGYVVKKGRDHFYRQDQRAVVTMVTNVQTPSTVVPHDKIGYLLMLNAKKKKPKT